MVFNSTDSVFKKAKLRILSKFLNWNLQITKNNNQKAKYYFEVLGEKVPRKARKSLNAKYVKFKGY